MGTWYIHTLGCWTTQLFKTSPSAGHRSTWDNHPRSLSPLCGQPRLFLIFIVLSFLSFYLIFLAFLSGTSLDTHVLSSVLFLFLRSVVHLAVLTATAAVLLLTFITSWFLLLFVMCLELPVCFRKHPQPFHIFLSQYKKVERPSEWKCRQGIWSEK